MQENVTPLPHPHLPLYPSINLQTFTVLRRVRNPSSSFRRTSAPPLPRCHVLYIPLPSAYRANPHLDSVEEGGEPFLILCPHVRPPLHEELDDLVVPPLRGDHERRDVVSVSIIPRGLLAPLRDRLRQLLRPACQRKQKSTNCVSLYEYKNEVCLRDRRSLESRGVTQERRMQTN